MMPRPREDTKYRLTNDNRIRKDTTEKKDFFCVSFFVRKNRAEALFS